MKTDSHLWLRERLAEVIRWLAANDGSIVTASQQLAVQSWSPEDPQAAVEEVVSKRSSLLSDLPQSRDSAAALGGGRLLLVLVAVNLMDAAAQAASDGFFDEWNYPPPCTWVGLVRSSVLGIPVETEVLVCWVPNNFVEAAGAGVEVNPEECIQWADEVQGACEFVERLLGSDP